MTAGRRSPVVRSGEVFAAFLLILMIASPFVARGVEVTPRVGIGLDHFGESYQVTEDADTVATSNDFGVIGGLEVRTSRAADRELRLDANVRFGQETHRFRLDFTARRRSLSQRLSFEHDGAFTVVADSDEDSLLRDHLRDWTRLSWERRLAEGVFLRLADSFDLTWYRNPDDLHINALLHRPAISGRVRIAESGEVRGGYEWAQRTLPDSSALNYRQHAGDFGLVLYPGERTTFDGALRFERRNTEPEGSRESFSEWRTDSRSEYEVNERWRAFLQHEHETILYDETNSLDFSSTRMRLGSGVGIRVDPRREVSIQPLLEFLTSADAPEEEYRQLALEVGFNWQIGDHLWVDLTNEAGHRDYQIDAPDDVGDLLGDDFPSDILDDPTGLFLDTSWSDYFYNRISLLLTSQPLSGASYHVLFNWEPESHSVPRDDIQTRYLSAGINYRF